MMNSHIASHPAGKKFYHLGAGFQITNNNRYQAIKGLELKRKLSQAEERHSDLIVCSRVATTNVLGKAVGHDLDYESQISLLTKAYVSKRIGTAFLLRCLTYIAREEPRTSAQELIDVVRRHIPFELKKRPVQPHRHLPA